MEVNPVIPLSTRGCLVVAVLHVRTSNYKGGGSNVASFSGGCVRKGCDSLRNDVLSDRDISLYLCLGTRNLLLFE